MRGAAFRYAMEHAEPELAEKIWKQLVTPTPSMDRIREQKARELDLKITKARKKYAEENSNF